MSLFNRLFGSRKPGTKDYFSAMVEMAEESERTYRGMVESYNRDVAIGVLSIPVKCKETVDPTGIGLYKARLFGALFLVHAYAASDHSKDEIKQLINVATGLALHPLVDSNELSFDREDARSLNETYLWPTFKKIAIGFKAGPIDPTSPIKNEHASIADQLHNALAESIGVECYTTQVRNRLEFAVIGNVASAMAHSAKWVFQ